MTGQSAPLPEAAGGRFLFATATVSSTHERLA